MCCNGVCVNVSTSSSILNFLSLTRFLFFVCVMCACSVLSGLSPFSWCNICIRQLHQVIHCKVFFLMFIEDIPLCLNSKVKQNLLKLPSKHNSVYTGILLFVYYTNIYKLLCFDGNFKTFCFTFDVFVHLLPASDGKERF
jgi:hypothetical protein